MIRRLVERLVLRWRGRGLERPAGHDLLDPAASERWAQRGPGASTFVDILGYAVSRERRSPTPAELADLRAAVAELELARGGEVA